MIYYIFLNIFGFTIDTFRIFVIIKTVIITNFKGAMHGT